MQAHAHHHGHNPFVTSAQATIHCLVGCVIGEVAGLIIGITLGLAIWQTIALATTLAYISGMTLGLLPVMRHQGKTFMQALKLIWIGEVLSIGVMEIAMNWADYAVGGMQAGSILEPVFWLGTPANRPRRPAGYCRCRSGWVPRCLAGQLLAYQARHEEVPWLNPIDQPGVLRAGDTYFVTFKARVLSENTRQSTEVHRGGGSRRADG